MKGLFKFFNMHISDFDFNLPSSLIAQFPCVPRDNSRLLHLMKNKVIDRSFRELPDLLTSNDLIIANNTKVIPTRITGKINLKKIEITLHKKHTNNSWFCFVKPFKKVEMGDIIEILNLKTLVEKKLKNGEILLKFNIKNDALISFLEKNGEMPLPPYVKRKNFKVESDHKDYQTIFASEDGAVAAPTAGLHFSEEIKSNLKKKNIDFDYVTLHVGAGTFLPVKVENILDHKMHEEWGQVNQSVVDKIIKCKSNGGRVLCIGTTTLRILESAAINNNGKIAPFKGFTNVFIYPGFKFLISDMLLTNFHLPKSTLFMLVCAFSGINQIKKAYNHAIKNNYRFFSYGDCSLLIKNE